MSYKRSMPSNPLINNQRSYIIAACSVHTIRSLAAHTTGDSISITHIFSTSARSVTFALNWITKRSDSLRISTMTTLFPPRRSSSYNKSRGLVEIIRLVSGMSFVRRLWHYRTKAYTRKMRESIILKSITLIGR